VWLVLFFFLRETDDNIKHPNLQKDLETKQNYASVLLDLDGADETEAIDGAPLPLLRT
jgi:hypothetical protein